MPATPALLSRAATVGWIGLGNMGHPMALNLFEKTFQAHQAASSRELPSFVICEQDDARADAFVRDLRERGGAELARRVERVGSGREMAVAAARIVTMLPSTPQVESVYLDSSQGILAGLKDLPPDQSPLEDSSDSPTSRDPTHLPRASSSSSTTTLSSPSPTASSSSSSTPETPLASLQQQPSPLLHTLLIDQTTLDPTAATAVAQRIHDETLGAAAMLDAPVSGGIVAATAGTLTIMFGSPSPHASALAVPLLQRMAREGGVIPCGGNGTGVGVKVCNNLILAINQIALAEGVALGRALNIDPLLLHGVINSSSGQSWSSRVNSPLAEVPNSPGSRNFSGGFQTRLMLKDVGLALHAAHTYDLPSPLGWAAHSVYEAVCKEGDGEWATKDFSVVLEWLRKKRAEGVERGWKDQRDP